MAEELPDNARRVQISPRWQGIGGYARRMQIYGEKRQFLPELKGLRNLACEGMSGWKRYKTGGPTVHSCEIRSDEIVYTHQVQQI